MGLQPSFLVGTGSTAPKFGVCENSLRSKYSSCPLNACLALKTEQKRMVLQMLCVTVVLPVQMQTEGRCWVSQHSSAWQEMMSRDCLLSGADWGSCSIYALAQCAIFIYSLQTNTGSTIQFLKLGYVMEKDFRLKNPWILAVLPFWRVEVSQQDFKKVDREPSIVKARSPQNP